MRTLLDLPVERWIKQRRIAGVIGRRSLLREVGGFFVGECGILEMEVKAEKLKEEKKYKIEEEEN